MNTAAVSDYADLIGEGTGRAVPFKLGGRTLDGLDCLGVCLEMARRRGVPLPDPWQEIGVRWRDGVRDVERLLPAGWRKVEDLRGITNDLVLFSLVPRERIASHAGWAVAPGMILSSLEPVGVVCSPLHRMLDRVVQVWRYVP
jgi:hypothetical protein